MAININGGKGITNASWTTSTRPLSPNDGQMGYNTDTNSVEVYNGTEWVAVGAGGGATGGGSDEVFVENSKVITTSYTIPADKNAMSTGDIFINPDVTVTVPSGSRWVIV